MIQQNTIYTINRRHQLWSYDLDTDTFTIQGPGEEDADYLTDIKANDLLLTIQVAAKKRGGGTDR